MHFIHFSLTVFWTWLSVISEKKPSGSQAMSQKQWVEEIMKCA